MSQWEHIASLVETGQRLSFDEALTLWQQAPLWRLGELAVKRKRQISGEKVFYNKNFHIEPTNLCVFNCKFCSFRRPKGSPEAWDMSMEEVEQLVRSYEGKGVTEVYERLVDAEIKRVKKTSLPPSEGLNKLLTERGETPLSTGARMSAIMKRPLISYDDLAPFDPERPELCAEIREQVDITVKYEGYIEKQKQQVEQFKKTEQMKIPDIDYEKIHGLRKEAQQKLAKIRPSSLGQASRISGVSSADIAVLMVYIKDFGNDR